MYIYNYIHMYISFIHSYSCFFIVLWYMAYKPLADWDTPSSKPFPICGLSFLAHRKPCFPACVFLISGFNPKKKKLWRKKQRPSMENQSTSWTSKRHVSWESWSGPHLVGGCIPTPLKKIRVRQLGWWDSQYFWENKLDVPNHQPDMIKPGSPPGESGNIWIPAETHWGPARKNPRSWIASNGSTLADSAESNESTTCHQRHGHICLIGSFYWWHRNYHNHGHS